MLKRFGSDWGGWIVDIDLIRDGDTILAAGMANDITFEEELLKQRSNLHFIGVDPTPAAVQRYRQSINEKLITTENYLHLAQALDSGENQKIQVEGVQYDTISFPELLTSCLIFEPISLVKLDIEGAEYMIFKNVTAETIRSVRQIGIEIHHWAEPPAFQGYTLQDSIDLINQIKSYGYRFVFHNVNVPARRIQEGLFIRNDLAGDYTDIDPMTL